MTVARSQPRKRAPAPLKSVPAKKVSVAAQEAEAGDGFVTVTHRGISLRVPVGLNVTIAATDAVRRGDNYEATKLMLGPAQWKKLSDAGMTLRELDELGKKVNEASGN